MTPQHDPKLKSWAIRLPVATELLNKFKTTSVVPKEVMPPVKLSAIRETIDEYFEHISDKCFELKHYQIFAGLLTDFFDNNPVSLPEVVIKTKYKSKNAIALIMSPLYRKFRTTGVLKNDNKYLNIIKKIDKFEEDDIKFIYRAITK